MIPAKYRGVSFERPPVTEMDEIVVRRVRNFCDAIDRKLDEGSGLWFFGGSGTGKTTLAMLVSRIALERGRSVAIYSLPKLLARIRRTYDGELGEQSYDQLFERLTTVDLLHVDDLGAENRTEWVLEQLYALVNERYEQGRSLLVTTNYDEDELRRQLGERTGDRIVSRLVEMCDPQPLYGADRRSRDEDAPARPAGEEDPPGGGGAQGGGGVPGGGGLPGGGLGGAGTSDWGTLGPLD